MPSESANKSAVCGECGRPISNESLKPKQVKLYRFIREYFDANQCAPSLTEMAESMGISTATAHGHLCGLRDLGYVEFTPWGKRSVKIIRELKGR